MNKAIKIILGIILFVIPIYFAYPGMPLESWGHAAWNLIKGGITLTVLIVGLVLIIIGIGELK